MSLIWTVVDFSTALAEPKAPTVEEDDSLPEVDETTVGSLSDQVYTLHTPQYFNVTDTFRNGKSMRLS